MTVDDLRRAKEALCRRPTETEIRADIDFNKHLTLTWEHMKPCMEACEEDVWIWHHFAATFDHYTCPNCGQEVW